MAKPWEKYQQQPDGPWARYQGEADPAIPTPQSSAPMADRDLTPEQVFPMSVGGQTDAFQTALGTLFTYSDEGQRNIWEKQLKDAGVEHEWGQDGSGNTILRYKDEDGQWQQGYINAPGVSGADALKPAAALGMFASGGNVAAAAGNAATRLAPGTVAPLVQAGTKTIGRRMALNAAGAGTLQAGVDQIAQETGADLPISERLTNAGVAAGFGALGEPVAKFVGGGLTKLWNVAKGGGAKQADAVRQIVMQSVDDDTARLFANADDQFWAGVATQSKGIRSPDELRLYAIHQAYRKEIPGFQVFKPYITKNVDDWTAFDEAARGGYGTQVQRDVGKSMAGNERAVSDRLVSLKAEATGGASVADDAASAGSILRQGVKERADDLWQQINDAYTAAGGKQGAFSPQAGQYLDQKVMGRLSEGNFLGRRGTLPPDAKNAAQALEEVQDIVVAFSGQADDGVRPLTFREFEKTRQYLNTLRGSAQGADKAAVNNIIRAYDEWADDMLNMALYNGDEGAIEAFKQARGLRAEYGRKFSPQEIRTRSGRKVQDAAGKVIEDIAELDLGPEKVVNNLFGKGRIGEAKESVEILRRLENVVGRDSTEWKALQEAGYMKLFYGANGQPKSTAQVVDSWKSITQGDGKYWARRLFGDEGLASMNRFVALLERTQMPRNAYNPSGPSIKKATDGIMSKAATMVARIKMPLISDWIETAAEQQAGRALAQQADRALQPGALTYLPSANLGSAVRGGGFAASAPASQAVLETVDRLTGR